MTVDVLTETVIDRAPELVAAFAGDPSNAPRWYTNIMSVSLLTPSPMGVGSKMAFVAHFLGRRLSYTYDTSEPAGNGKTRMTLRNRGEPTGFSRIGAPLMAGAMRRANAKDLARLKAIMEQS